MVDTKRNGPTQNSETSMLSLSLLLNHAYSPILILQFVDVFIHILKQFFLVFIPHLKNS